MMWFIIISIIVLVLSKFLWDRHKMILDIKHQGGMKVIYAKLISLLMTDYPNSEIFREKDAGITFGVADTFTVILFEIIPTFKTVTVVYRYRSRFLGKHSLQWTLDRELNQEFMYYTIKQDIESYLNKTFSKIKS